jgi:ethanolamine ammonia-lyase large subunit
MGRATPQRSGDELAGVAARSAEERAAAKKLAGLSGTALRDSVGVGRPGLQPASKPVS